MELALGTEPVGGVRTAGRDAEFAAYMTARQRSLLRTAYLLTGNHHEAEDLVQTAFAKLYLSWDKVQRRESVDGYLRRILVNENNSRWHRARSRHEVPVDSVPEREAPGSAGQDSALWEVVRRLPRRQRATLVLRYYEGLTEAETAAVLGVSVGTVKSQSSRALAAIRASVDRAGYLPEDGRSQHGQPYDGKGGR